MAGGRGSQGSLAAGWVQTGPGTAAWAGLEVAGGGVGGRSARVQRPRLMVQVEMFCQLFEHFTLLPISLCHPYLVLWFGLHAPFIYVSAEQHLREDVSDADFADELGNPTPAISAGPCTYSSVQKREEVAGHEQQKTSGL